MIDWIKISEKRFKEHQIEEGEMYVRETRSSTLEFRNGEIERLKEENDFSAACRIINKSKLGFSYTTSLTEKTLSDTIARANDFSKYNTENPNMTILNEQLQDANVSIYDSDILDIDTHKMVEFAKRIENAARAYDERVFDFRNTSVRRGYGKISIFNTHGINKGYDFTFIYFLTELLAKQGNKQEMGYYMLLSPTLSNISPEDVGRKAARHAVSMLGGKKYKTGKFIVVLSPEAAVDILGALSPSFFGENVMKGKSMYAGMIDKKIASEKIDIINDGTIPFGVSSSSFDDEGVPTQKTQIIEKGVLKTYLHDLYSANYFKTKSTGSGFKSSIKALPGNAPANFHIVPGNRSFNEILKDLPHAIYITSIMGAHTINPISGDFSVGISGQLIKNGTFSQPLKGMALAGNVKDLLNGIIEVGNDLIFFPQGIGGSTLVVEGLSVSGE